MAYRERVMGPGLIVLVIVVVISLLISVASNWLRNQQRQIEAAAAEKRARNRVAGGASPVGKAGAGDIDRFLEEINKLRQKPADRAEPATRSAQKADTSRPPKPVTPRRAEPVAPPAIASPRLKLDDLPVAPVVARPLPAASPVTPVRTAVTKSASSAGPPTELARQFNGLLTNPKSLPMAVLLQEILGPPKSKRV